MKQVADAGIVVECCLTSNVGWKVKSYVEHPIRQMFDAGVKVFKHNHYKKKKKKNFNVSLLFTTTTTKKIGIY